MNISVLGCGWLGFPLAQRLVSKNYHVKGSTTTQKKMRLLRQNGVEPFLIRLPEFLHDENILPFWESDILFLNIPPGRKTENVEQVYPTIIKEVAKKCKENDLSWIIFASSTSVYGKTGGYTTESDALQGKAARPAGEAILKTEEIIRECGTDYTILRFGGLYGYGRHPVHQLSGRKNLSDPCKPVNLIHQTDCLNIIMEIILQKKRNEIYNVVSDGHPPRKEFYECAAKYYNLPLPHFLENGLKDYKVVSNKKLKDDLFYTFSYPNPMDYTP